MQGKAAILVVLAAQFLLPTGHARGQAAAEPQVVDRIVARIEDDILTLSELRELARFQQVVEGRAASDDQLVSQLVAQWIVNREATAARFPLPSKAEVDREMDRLEKQFGGAEAFQEQLRQAGLPAEAARRLVERQLYFARYLDYKFRPAVQPDAAAVEQYYREELARQLAARGQPVPPLQAVRDEIRELLIQRGISERAARWLEESRARLKIELEPSGNGAKPR